MAPALTVTIRYFAILKEQAGCASETVRTSCKSLHDLYEEMRGRHGLGLEARHVRVAVNGHFAEMSEAPHEGDEVAFLPPVAGG